MTMFSVVNKDLEFALQGMQKRIEEADPGLHPQMHPINEGKVLDTRSALETAHCMLSEAQKLMESGDYETGMEFMQIAAGIGMVNGVIFGDDTPEPNVAFEQTKPI
jgi:hypothetical protein